MNISLFLAVSWCSKEKSRQLLPKWSLMNTLQTNALSLNNQPEMFNHSENWSNNTNLRIAVHQCSVIFFSIIKRTPLTFTVGFIVFLPSWLILEQEISKRTYLHLLQEDSSLLKKKKKGNIKVTNTKRSLLCSAQLQVTNVFC